MDSGWCTVARNGERRKITNVEESKRERVGGGKEVLSPSLPNPAPSPFFLAHFSFRFPNYLKACYRLTTCIPSFPTFCGIYSTWASSTFGAFLLISWKGFGSTNFSLTHSLSSPTPLYSRQEGTTIFFAPDHSFDYWSVLGLRKKRAVFWSERLCTDWHFSVMETLDVILNCNIVTVILNRLKGWKFLSTAFGKRTSSFPQKKNK